MTVAAPRVLLISESRITRRVVEMTFADQQVELVTAGTSQEGLAAWDDAPAAVVLADITMDAAPDGLALARHVQAHAGGRPVAVLLLAGQHDVVDEAEVAAAGVRGRAAQAARFAAAHRGRARRDARRPRGPGAVGARRHRGPSRRPTTPAALPSRRAEAATVATCRGGSRAVPQSRPTPSGHAAA